MVRECTEEDRALVIEYLKQEAVYNTFMLADIADFGFEEVFQTVYVDEEPEGIKGVYLCFYQNFLLYCREHEVNMPFLEQLFSVFAPDVIMGKTEDMRKVQWILPDYTLESRSLYLFREPEELAEETAVIRKAELKDVDEIFSFLQSIPELKHLYTSRQMIEDRIGKGCGTHYIVRDGEKIIAHANSAAESELTTMIGGVSTAAEYRGQGLAGQIVSRLCRDILAEKKQPCLFSIRGEKDNLYSRIGFRKIGEWGTLTRLSEGGEPDKKLDKKEEYPEKKPEEKEREAEPEPSESGGSHAEPLGTTVIQGAGIKRLPSYVALYNSLYQDIVQGVYEKGSLLPSENVLSEKYHVSRNTLRQALAILNQDGYIYKKQGKGTYISYDSTERKKEKIYNFLVEDALEEIVAITMDHNVGTPTLIAKKKLKLKEGEEVLASNNVYAGENGPVGQSFLQIPMRLLEEQGVDIGSEEALLTFMNETVYRLASEAELTIQLMEADEQVVPYLHVEPGTALLHFEQLLYDGSHIPAARIKYYFCSGKYQIQYKC